MYIQVNTYIKIIISNQYKHLNQLFLNQQHKKIK